MQELITLANRLADTAGDVIRGYFRQDFTIETKSDASPVTVADRTAEERMRALIEEVRPQDGILGEEFGPKGSESGLTWVFDPIDGTKSFISGRPTFGTLIALWDGEDKPLIGIIDQPVLKERWIGIAGQPTTFCGKVVKTRPCGSLRESVAAATTPVMFADHGAALEKSCKSMVWGGDCYAYGALANGWLDMVAESDLGTYDYAAMPPIIEGAGGTICGWDGEPLRLKREGKSSVLALGDARLRDMALNLLGEGG